MEKKTQRAMSQYFLHELVPINLLYTLPGYKVQKNVNKIL